MSSRRLLRLLTLQLLQKVGEGCLREADIMQYLSGQSQDLSIERINNAIEVVMIFLGGIPAVIVLAI